VPTTLKISDLKSQMSEIGQGEIMSEAQQCEI
jgi:hypothetical protein